MTSRARKNLERDDTTYTHEQRRMTVQRRQRSKTMPKTSSKIQRRRQQSDRPKFTFVSFMFYVTNYYIADLSKSGTKSDEHSRQNQSSKQRAQGKWNLSRGRLKGERWWLRYGYGRTDTQRRYASNRPPTTAVKRLQLARAAVWLPFLFLLVSSSF
ncbi:hypothetical protein KIN20_005026 [Parelaphostrongylus tenuis]|uniref:Uncharacterized protein n=1 Tax=Parelaphostrongylus tenuis TaxID=148309 RepID=A0AAD5MS61_PARTN|nr:hypothetical protein KIN20_005026 [Parelaphostrongylus tenuis]